MVNKKDIPVVVLCGGKGIYDSNLNKVIPKCLVEINGKLLIEHILKMYQDNGFENFILACGQNFELIKAHISSLNDSKIKVLDTGENSLTAKRVFHTRELLGDSEYFAVTYSDTISDINLNQLLEFHLQEKCTATVVAAHMPVRFRVLGLRPIENKVRGFANRPVIENDWINGGYYFFNKDIWKHLDRYQDKALENEVLESLLSEENLIAFRHKSFWQPLDNERDIVILQNFLQGHNHV